MWVRSFYLLGRPSEIATGEQDHHSCFRDTYVWYEMCGKVIRCFCFIYVRLCYFIFWTRQCWTRCLQSYGVCLSEWVCECSKCVPVSVSKEKKHLFYTNHICTPECQEGTPPCFFCAQDMRYSISTESLILAG